MSRTATDAVKVGLFAAIAMAVAGYLILKAEDLRLFGGKGERVEAVFDSVAGLDDKAAVRVAGVRVGRVDGIRLAGQKAYVTLLLEQPLELGEGTTAAIANMGLLGDKYVELTPGPEGAPPLAAGAAIPGSTPASFDAVIAKVSDFADSLQQVTGQLTGARGEGPLANLLENLEGLSQELRELVAANRAAIDATVGNAERVSQTLATDLPRLSARFEALLQEIQGAVAESRGPLRDGLSQVEQLAKDVQVSVDNLNTITDRLARGEGTIGKLLASDEAHDALTGALGKVEEGVGKLSNTLGRVEKLQLELGLEGMWLDSFEESRGAFSLDLDPQSGRKYRIAIVDDPRGRRRVETETITVTNPDGSVETRVVETETIKDETSVSALFGFPLGERTEVWAGLVESRFGVQVDYRPAERWRLSLEAFDFDRRDDLDPHLRLTVGWEVHRNLYLLGGYDDPLVDENRGAFIGAGIRWRDDDLKYLLGSVPSF
jgi:phospholipid/cholesterol/gamma-HCH transport system substrate-binding protein